MGRNWNGIPLAPGVEVRENENGATVSIRFAFHNIRCRELKLPATLANLKFATDKLDLVSGEIKRNQFVYSNHFPDSPRCRLFGGGVTNKLFSEALDEYEKDAKLAHDGWQKEQRLINKHIRPHWATTPLRDISIPRLKDWIRGLFKPKDEAPGLVAKTVRNILSPMRVVLDAAVLEGDIKENPLKKIELKLLTPKDQEYSDYQPDPFNEAERAALVKIAPDQWRNLLVAWWWSGLRASEIIALKWSCLDFVNGQISVNAANPYGAYRKRTKTAGSTRLVQMLPHARAALMAQKPYTFIADQDGFVFHNPGNNKPWRATDSLTPERGPWYQLCKRAGVRYRGPNQCRHTYAGIMINLNRNLWWIAGQMGHRKRKSGEPNVEMLMRHYGNDIRKRDENAAAPNEDWAKVAV